MEKSVDVAGAVEQLGQAGQGFVEAAAAGAGGDHRSGGPAEFVQLPCPSGQLLHLFDVQVQGQLELAVGLEQFQGDGGRAGDGRGTGEPIFDSDWIHLE